MPTTTRKRRIPRLKTVTEDLAGEIKSYLANRSMRERSEHEEGRIKRLLMSVLEETGDQVGNKQVIILDDPLPYRQYKGGKPQDKLIAGVERRRSTTNTLDEAKALTFLTAHKNRDLIKECTTTVVVVDEDALLAANYDGKITDKQLSALYTESERYSFWLTEEPS